MFIQYNGKSLRTEHHTSSLSNQIIHRETCNPVAQETTVFNRRMVSFWSGRSGVEDTPAPRVDIADMES